MIPKSPKRHSLLFPTLASFLIAWKQFYSSFSFCAPFRFCSCSSSILPVTGRWRTASGPQTVSNPLWKAHSVASSTGLSKRKGRKGTAASPSCEVFCQLFSPFKTLKCERVRKWEKGRGRGNKGKGKGGNIRQWVHTSVSPYSSHS